MYGELRNAGLYSSSHAAPLTALVLNSGRPPKAIVAVYKRWRPRAVYSGDDTLPLTSAAVAGTRATETAGLGDPAVTTDTVSSHDDGSGFSLGGALIGDLLDNGQMDFGVGFVAGGILAS